MRAKPLAEEVAADRVDLEALQEFLMSDRSPPGSMTLSEIDGFLTGIAVRPELVPAREWLPLIFGGEVPEFAGPDEANATFGSLIGRYKEILHEIADGAAAPVFWVDRDGTYRVKDWTRGFFQAIVLRIDAWEPLFGSKRHGMLLFPILTLCCDKNGDSLLGLPRELEDSIAERAPDLLPGCVIGIAAYWRRKRSTQNSLAPRTDPRPAPNRAATRVGRNDPCPCGSGRKFKKCCGQSAVRN